MSKLSESFKKPRTLDEQVDSICLANSYLSAVNRIKEIAANADAYGTDQVRLILETAQVHEVRAKKQRPAVRLALRNALNKLPKATVPAPPSKQVSIDVIPAKEGILQDACKALEKLRGIIAKHEETLASVTLGPRLQMGLQCLKAHEVFSLPDPAKRNKSGKNQHSKGLVTRDEASPEGFEGWLATHAQWLKKPTAYKYMNAVRGMGLDHTASEKQLAHALKLLLRKGPVTIAGLVAQSLDPFGPPPPPPPKIEQQEFQFLRETLSGFRQESDSLLNIKDKLDSHPDFKRAATARIYSLLYELTGTHWRPSDEPDDLASVDPDAISI